MRSAWLSAAVLPLVLVVALGSGCTQRSTPPVEQLDKQALAEDSQYVAREYAKWLKARGQGPSGGPLAQMPLNLHDASQYRFVRNRLKAVGLEEENSPRLFQHLRELRASATPGATPQEGSEEVKAAGVRQAEQAPARWCGHLLPFASTGADAQRTHFEGAALTSCFNGADYGFVDLNVYAIDEAWTSFELLASEFYDEYAAKVLETPPVKLSVARDAGQMLLVDSLAMAFDERSGQYHFSYVSSQLMIFGGAALELEHPRDLGEDNPHEQGTVRICLERGSVEGQILDCDYASVRKEADGSLTPFPSFYAATGIAALDAQASRSGGTPRWTADPNAYWEPPSPTVYDPTHFQVPARGTFSTSMPDYCWPTQERPNAWVAAVLEESGGVCVPGQDSGTEVGWLETGLPWTTPTESGVFPFNGIIDFGKANCLDHQQNIQLQILASMPMRCRIGSRLLDFECPAPRMDISPMDFKRICLAEGTQVLAADGSLVPVEQVKVGDKLISNADGRALTVTTLSRGGESKPLVKLKDEAGGEVMMTDTHPVVTVARGVLQAGEVKPGDKVLTRSGPRKLVAVERVPYDGRVYNVALGTEEELAAAGGPEARTLYANGFLVGDSYLQTELEKARRTDAREVLAKLHESWHRDFRLHQQRQKTARR